MGVVGPRAGRAREPAAQSENRTAAEPAWKGGPQRVTSPVGEAGADCDARHPSSAGHVKPGAKLGGPPSKAEYSPVTDSGPVP